MFNIQPGTGLGFTGSKEIALGLGSPFAAVAVIHTPRWRHTADGFDWVRHEEDELVAIIHAMIQSGMLN